MSERIRAPWTDEQVAALNRWQGEGAVHPFTCPADGTHGSARHSDRRILVADNQGWVCEWNDCGYRQQWAHDFMLDTPALRRPEYRITPTLRVVLALDWSDDEDDAPVLGAFGDDTITRFSKWQMDNECFAIRGTTVGPGFWLGSFDMADAPNVMRWLEAEGLTRRPSPTDPPAASGPFVALPPLTPDEAEAMVDVLTAALEGAWLGDRGALLNSLRTAYAEAVGNWRPTG